MQRPRQFSPQRAFGISRRVPRTRTEAAAELVRLEYERDRVERDLKNAELRQKRSASQLEIINKRAKRLRDVLADEVPKKKPAPEKATAPTRRRRARS